MAYSGENKKNLALILAAHDAENGQPRQCKCTSVNSKVACVRENEY